MFSIYALLNNGRVLHHYHAMAAWLGDYAAPRDPELDAIARSGDFFVTLATKLENIATELPETNTVTSSLHLSKLAQELEYMQRHYSIVRKHASSPEHPNI